MHENNHSSSRKNDDDPSNFSIFLQGLDYSKMGLERRNFQGRKKRAEKFNKNAQKRQISMKELRYAQKLLKGKRFWPYFQHLDFFPFLDSFDIYSKCKFRNDIKISTFFAVRLGEKNDEMKMQFYNSNLRVINLSECFQKFSYAHCVILRFFVIITKEIQSKI